MGVRGRRARRAGAAAPGAEAGFRDPKAERAVLAALDVRLAEFGLRSSRWAAPACDGLDTMRFTTELLPLLDDTPGLLVEQHR